MDEEYRTLKEWRELKGLTREELEEKSGVPVEVIARLEEVGDPTYANTIEGDLFLNGAVGPIMEALELSKGVTFAEVPSEALPGNFVLDPAALSDLDESIVRFLIEHAEEIGLRVAVPNKWDVGLKRFGDVADADGKAIKEWCEREAAYGMAMAKYHGDMAALLSEHATDENQKTGDVLEERDGRWVPKRRREEDG